MLRIQCESCQAPYQVDERRVPAQGLKMRCPKCGHTFMVQKPETESPGSVPDAPTEPKRAKATMVGLGLEALGKAAPAQPKPVAPEPVAPAPAAPALVAAADTSDADLPAARPGPKLGSPPRPGAPRPGAGVPLPKLAARTALGLSPAAQGAAEDADLPAPANADLPARAADLPARPAIPRAKMAQPAAKTAQPAKAAPEAQDSPDLPAALGKLDELDLPARPAAARPAAAAPPAGKERTLGFGELDLPAVAADLPAARPGAAPQPQAPPAPTFDLDLPTSKRPALEDDLELDLGPPAADLPAPIAALPALAAGLPALGAALPAKKDELAFGEIDLPLLGAQLPNVADALPEVATVLPSVGQQLPATVGDELLVPAAKADELADFGEIDLGGPGEAVGNAPELELGASTSSKPPRVGASAFGELDLGIDDLKSLPPEAASPAPPPAPPAAPPPAPKLTRDPNALAFGEVDLGGQAGFDASSFQTEQAPPAQSAPTDELSLPQVPAVQPSGEAMASGGAELSLPITTGQRRTQEVEEKPSRGPRVAMVLFLLLALGGGALQLTKHGAFGYLTVGDYIHAKDYARYADAQAAAARTLSAKDVFPEARGAVDDLFSAHWRMPRAHALTAYAAFSEFAYETRFGADVARNAKAKLLLAGLPADKEVHFANVALAAEDAAAGNLDKARQGLEAASKRDVGAPIQQDIALLRGEVELQAKDTKAAKTAFEAALKLGPTAQAHYGLARAARAQNDWEVVGRECDAALAISPNHPGSLLLRALSRYSAKASDTNALADLAAITDGAAKPLASDQEIGAAYATRGTIYLLSGRAGDARGAFESALKVDPRNVDALVGQGMVLFQESRFTEALTRFDTALGARKDDELAIAYDARTKIHLERLTEAKDQLVAARAKFPRSMQLAFALGEAESSLGNYDAAEKALRQATDLSLPKDPGSVQPFIALATLLVARNHDSEAAAVIDDAKSKLPESAPFEVALGEYGAGQGKYDEAVAHFKRALVLSPGSLSTHFKLGVTYRHMRKTELATQQFDQVLAIDKDYPGLALERGLLFEESGEVERALEQFKNALARAPDDADLQLRVGAAYVAVHRSEDALPMLRTVLEKRPNSAEANHYLGRALFEHEGPGGEAMRFLKRAVEIDPNRPEYHLYVAEAANESSPAKLGLAEQEIEKALALDKLMADAYWQRGVLECKKLEVEDAIKDLRHALELRPSRIEAHAALAECYEAKNDNANALGEWRTATAANDHVPFWRYRIGKLLLDRNAAAEAAPHLSYAVAEALKLETHPAWLSRAEFSAAEALRKTGKRAEAIAMYNKYLEIAASNDPDRRDAMSALSGLGAPYKPPGRF
ncbi:MAG TPA: tetratricopeptide repeat protein [Polyangiaceae bacterium]|nr:tetratricopeptide repeat protein [Polyangiaceae bacterium]